MMPLQQSATVPSTTAGVARALAYVLVALTALGLLRYLRTYTRQVLVDPYRGRWRYLAVGIGAAGVYGVAGLAEVLGVSTAVPFRRGATLFFFLFCAVGVRAVYRSVGGTPLLSGRWPELVGTAVILVFGLSWWGAYLFTPPATVVTVELVGLLVATVYTLYYAVATVRAEEGTSIAAYTRQFVPALLSVALVAVAEHADQFLPVDPAVGRGVALVGTVLAGAFLFTTAVAIRQQSGEVSRMYDPTTWRAESLDDEPPESGVDD